jgi:hypothetical protein
VTDFFPPRTRELVHNPQLSSAVAQAVRRDRETAVQIAGGNSGSRACSWRRCATAHGPDLEAAPPGQGELATLIRIWFGI